MGEYLSCAETAKLLRAALKKAFPGVKFSVRSDVYAGGASIRVRWTDGPSKKAVEAVAKPYAGGGFDGMIDMAYHTQSWLMPDGSVSAAYSPGTSGSRGMHEGYSYPKPSPDAKLVSFGADFVFCEKEFSLTVYKAAVEKVCADYGVDLPVVEETGFGWCKMVPDPYVPNGCAGLSTLVHRELSKENA